MKLTRKKVNLIKKSLEFLFKNKKRCILSLCGSKNSAIFNEFNTEIIKYEKEINDLKDKIEFIFSMMNKSCKPPAISKNEKIILNDALELTKDDVNLAIKIAEGMTIENEKFWLIKNYLTEKYEKLEKAHYILWYNAKN